MPEYEFLGHSAQFTTPGKIANVSLPHGEQEAGPVIFFWVPRGQDSQGPPRGPVEPSGHRILQSDKLPLAAGDVAIPGQGRHGAGPVEFL